MQQRNVAIDCLRGLVMLLMTIDHARDMFSSISIGDHLGVELPLSHYIARWITHLCAPTFIFLAGFSVVLRQEQQHVSSSAVQLLLVKRGVFLILLSFTLISFFWTVILGDKVFTLYAAELWAIGAGMVFLAGMLFFPPAIILVTSLLLVAGHHLLTPLDQSTSLLWSMLHVKRQYILIADRVNIISFYPLLPWLGIIGVGYVSGLIWKKTENALRKYCFLLLALLSFSLFVWLRYSNLYGDETPFILTSGNLSKTWMSFFDVTKYPPSLLFSLITLGFVWFFLAWSDSAFFSKPTMLIRFISEYGKAALFYYMLHLGLVALYAHLIAFGRGGVPLTSSHISLSLAMALVVTLTSYPLVKWFIGLRKQHKHRFPLLNYM